jgi:hypothetical protein
MKIVLIFLCFFHFALTSQSQHCVTDSLQSLKMQNTEYAELFEQKKNVVQGYIDHYSNNRTDCDSTYLIPVAVHFQGVSFDLSCGTSKALDQISILNNDFGGTNTDLSIWNDLQPIIWPTINNGTSCMQFAIATNNHPDGFGLEDGDYAITLNQTLGDFDINWSNYLNFWVRDLGGGILSYSPFGG